MPAALVAGSPLLRRYVFKHQTYWLEGCTLVEQVDARTVRLDLGQRVAVREYAARGRRLALSDSEGATIDLYVESDDLLPLLREIGRLMSESGSAVSLRNRKTRRRLGLELEGEAQKARSKR